MERTPVRSRDIAVVGYDGEKQLLEVAFRTGGVYHYKQVSESLYRDLLAAPSIGKYFEEHVKRQFAYTKIH